MPGWELKSRPFSWAKKGESSAGSLQIFSFFFSAQYFWSRGQRIHICHMFPVNANALGPGAFTLGTPPTLWHLWINFLVIRET